MRPVQRSLLVLWLLPVLLALLAYVLHPEWATAAAIREAVAAYPDHVLFAYVVLSLGRGLFLWPSTPFVLAGAALFPEQPWLVGAISMAGVLAGAAYGYYIPELLGLDVELQRRLGPHRERMLARLQTHGFWIVALWSFLPVVPTDLMAYVAGSTRMRPWQFFGAVVAGEVPLITIYVVTGKALSELFL